MKKLSILLVVILSLVLVFNVGFAAPNDNKGPKNNAYGKVNKSEEKEKFQRKELANQIIDSSEELMSLQEKYDTLEDKESEEALQLKSQIEALSGNIEMSKKLAKEIRKEIRNRIRESYTAEELENVQTIANEIRNTYEGIKILPVDSVLSNKGKFKFDVPPVIKEGRTLIPVRAITEGFGAEVDWNGEEQKVTITKDDITIELIIDNNTAIVNGEEIEMDTQASLMCSRTVVPLRFIAETLGLDVTWNEEDESIELDEDETSEDGTEEDATEETAEDTATDNETNEEGTTEDTATDNQTTEGDTSEDTTTEDQTSEDQTV